MFTICETLFLLAIDDAEGDLVESVAESLEPVLATAALAELALLNRITLEDGRVTVVEPALTENPVLDHVLNAIADTKRSRKVKYWINTFTYEQISSDIGQNLVEKGVMTRQKKRLVLVVPYGDRPGWQVSAKYELKDRLRLIVLAGQPLETHELIQLAILYHCDLLALIFTKDEYKLAMKNTLGLMADHPLEPTFNQAFTSIVAVVTRLLK